ncbi:MAG TPA: methylglyoxal synthase [Peptococcaceae bacterium]|nr:methylglyoxal synthase [Peptococcaceae bacterium]
MLSVALIAHDQMKPKMIEFTLKYKDILAKCKLIATGTTGSLIEEHTGLQVEKVLSGPLGGDQQIGSKISCGKVNVVVFLRDPLTAQPHEPDITALLRICDVHNIPVATNRKTAEILISYIQDHLAD